MTQVRGEDTVTTDRPLTLIITREVYPKEPPDFSTPCTRRDMVCNAHPPCYHGSKSIGDSLSRGIYNYILVIGDLLYAERRSPFYSSRSYHLLEYDERSFSYQETGQNDHDQKEDSYTNPRFKNLIPVYHASR